MTLESLIDLMIAKRVLRCDYFCPDASNEYCTKIELHPSAFEPRPAATEETPENPDKDCQCGHPLLSAHNAAGCLLGCAIDTCKMGEPEGTEP